MRPDGWSNLMNETSASRLKYVKFRMTKIAFFALRQSRLLNETDYLRLLSNILTGNSSVVRKLIVQIFIVQVKDN